MDVPLSFTWCFGPLFSSRSSSTCYCLFIIDQKFTSSRQIMSVESLDDYKEHTGKSSVRSNGELISSPTPVSNSSHALLFALSSRSSSLPLPSRSMIENGIMVLRMNIFLNLTAVWKHYLLRSIPIIHRAVPIPAISSIIESVNGSSTELLTGKYPLPHISYSPIIPSDEIVFLSLVSVNKTLRSVILTWLTGFYRSNNQHVHISSDTRRYGFGVLII